MSLHFHNSLFADFSFAQGKSIRCLCFAQLRTSFRLSTICLKIALTVGAALGFVGPGRWGILVTVAPERLQNALRVLQETCPGVETKF